MSFSDAVFQLFIGPLSIIFEFIFYYAKIFTNSAGAAIIALGLVMNFMLLPLYKQADAIQNEEREQEKRMEHWLSHIKKTFSGNERFMMTQTYYRQNNYKPWYSLRGMMPLLLEVPFFIAAYNYLSGLESLSVPFGPISDLSKPDGLIYISGVSINLLPIIMTVVNIISGAIYTKGLKFKDKIQLYGMAALFLVLLYDSPSGLVIYWTVNNLFSLVRNIISKLKNPRMAANITLCAAGAAAAVWAFAMPARNFSDRMPMLDIALAFQIPMLIYLMKDRISHLKAKFNTENKPDCTALFFSGAAFMTLLTGVLIPASVVSSSPSEFVVFWDYHSPLLHILYSFLLAAGFFIVWMGLFYFLLRKTIRWLFSIAIWVISGFAVINYLFFSIYAGSLNSELNYSLLLYVDPVSSLINIAVLPVAAVIFILLWKKSKKAVQTVYIALMITAAGMSGADMIHINEAVTQIPPDTYENMICLSKNQKNVIVLMLDRAIDHYIPYLFQEKPELKKQFDGFTYYPNTISFGKNTNYASPALYGGYEYTPTEINKRSDEKLSDKQNEAMKVMPVLFDRNDYDVTVVEPTYAGYKWIPDLSIYDEYPDIRTYNSEEGQLVSKELADKFLVIDKIWKRNFFCYSIMKTSPLLMQPLIYQDGDYYFSHNKWISIAFLNSYAVLDALPSVTVCESTENSTFLMMSNSTTHAPQLLEEPDYVPSIDFDNEQYDLEHEDRFIYNGKKMNMDNKISIKHYHVNMAALLKLGQWFDYLRENGVYDNTRIIIAADHGADYLYPYDDMLLNDNPKEDAMKFNPLFLVKDFNSKGFKTDNSFMTNADVPTIAMSNIISDPVNPFTGKPVNNDAKQGEQFVVSSENWTIDDNNGNVFKPGQWYSVHDNIFDISNWKRLDVH